MRGALIEKRPTKFAEPKPAQEIIDNYFGFVGFVDVDNFYISVDEPELYTKSGVARLNLSNAGGQSTVSSEEYTLLTAFDVIYTFARVDFKALSTAAVHNYLSPMLTKPGAMQKLKHLLSQICTPHTDEATNETMLTLLPYYKEMYEKSAPSKEDN